jgi:hypothetical protein
VIVGIIIPRSVTPTAIVPGVIIPGIIVPGVIIICVRIVPVAVIKVAVPVHYIPKQVIIQRVVKTTVMTETVKTACQVKILNGIIVSFGVRTVIVINISLLTTFGINHIDCVMNVDGRHIVQYRTILILYLAGSVSITAVILIGITVYYDLRSSLDYRSSLLICNFRFSIRRCTGHHS